MAFGNGPRIVTDGLILHYDFADQNSYKSGSSTVYDLTGNGYNGSLLGTYSYSSKYNGSIFLNNSSSSNGYIDITQFTSASNALGASFNYSVMAAVDRTNYGIGGNNTGDSYIYMGAGNGYNEGYRINMGVGSPTGSIVSGTTSLIYSNSNNGSPQNLSVTGIQNNIIFCVSRNSSTINIFTNGSTSQTTLSNNYVPAIYASPTIGPTYAGVGCFIGYITFFMIYNRSLSTSEITQNYTIMKKRFNL